MIRAFKNNKMKSNVGSCMALVSPVRVESTTPTHHKHNWINEKMGPIGRNDRPQSIDAYTPPPPHQNIPTHLPGVHVPAHRHVPAVRESVLELAAPLEEQPALVVHQPDVRRPVFRARVGGRGWVEGGGSNPKAGLNDRQSIIHYTPHDPNHQSHPPTDASPPPRAPARGPCDGPGGAGPSLWRPPSARGSEAHISRTAPWGLVPPRTRADPHRWSWLLPMTCRAAGSAGGGAWSGGGYWVWVGGLSHDRGVSIQSILDRRLTVAALALPRTATQRLPIRR